MYYNLLLLFNLCLLLSCQSTPPDSGIPMLETKPTIDGRLDEGLETLEAQSFNYIWQFNNPVTDTVPLSYRLAYTPEHLYLYIEAETDSLIYRRRGFSNGDGYKLMLGLPQVDSLTDEFYSIYYSPSKDFDYWTRQRIWEYNREIPNRDLTEASESQELAYDGKCGFEALIAWQDIPPYHPWFNEQMGYNLYFAKALADTITNGYSVVEDEGIWDEAIPKRNFELLPFALPKQSEREFLVAQVKERHLVEGQKLVVETAGIAPAKSQAAVVVLIKGENGKPLSEAKLSVTLAPSFQRKRSEINLGKLAEGKYQVAILNGQDTIHQTKLCIFPDLDLDSFREVIQSNASQLSLGTQSTLLFRHQQLAGKLRRLKSYESGSEVYDYWTTFKTEYDEFIAGKDPYKGRTEAYRRAFQSKYDQSYQPYSIRLPQNYDPSQKYPLLVFLHGSGTDEQGLLNRPRSNGDFIEIAPLGRDIFYCYASDSSQNDIVEAIHDVFLHFPVDQEQVIIAGFSMGGYGALRTYYEHPELYQGVAVMAGHPYLADLFLDEQHPHFLKPAYLEKFKDVPVFVYHGYKDGSLPIAEAKNLIAALQTAGAQVTPRLDREKGHQWPTAATVKVYHDWLEKTRAR